MAPNFLPLSLRPTLIAHQLQKPLCRRAPRCACVFVCACVRIFWGVPHFRGLSTPFRALSSQFMGFSTPKFRGLFTQLFQWSTWKVDSTVEHCQLHATRLTHIAPWSTANYMPQHRTYYVVCFGMTTATPALPHRWQAAAVEDFARQLWASVY